MSIERRFVKYRGSGSVREFVLAATAGQETLGGPEVAKAELERLVAPLRAVQQMAVVDEGGDEVPWRLYGVSDVAELAELSDLAPEGMFALGGYLDEIIDVFGSVEEGSVLSMVMATPGEPDGVAEALWGQPSGESAVAMRAPLVSAQRRPVRFRLRLAGTQSLPPSVLALAGALALGPTQSAGRGWRRAAGPVQQAAARRAVESLATGAWWSPGPVDDELCSSTVAAATLMSLPARSDALDHLPLAMAPVSRPQADGAPIGRVADRSGALVSQCLPWQARTRHTYCAGASGTGKSSLLGQVLACDLRNGRTAVVIDPHGPLSEQVLGLVPEARLDDVLVIDPLDPRGAALDLIPPPDVEDPHRTATRISDAIEELHDPGQHKQIVGPRLIQAVQMAVIALLDQATLEDPEVGPVIADVERMIAQRGFRSKIIPRIRDQRVREFWKSWDAQSDFHQSEVLMYMTSKFTPLTNGPLRNALSQPARYRLEEVIRSRAIVVCQIPVGELGVRSSNFVGRLILARLLDALAATGRTAVGRRSTSLA